jgi:PAS domain S-box-containing protein
MMLRTESALHFGDRLADKQPVDYEDFFENGAVPLHLVGSDGTILRANRAELSLLGYSHDEYVGQPVAKFHADQAVIRDIFERLNRRDTIEKYPARLLAKDGSIKHVEITSSAQSRNGQFINARCFTIDVTDAKRAQEELKHKERQFQQILDAVPAAIYTTDAAGKITYYNRAAVEWAGREPEVGKDEWCVTFRLRTPDGKPLPLDECPMAIALKENRPVRGIEALAQRPDGTTVPFLPFPTPIQDDDGNLIGGVNLLVDLTEHKRIEEQVLLLAREADHRARNLMALVQAMVNFSNADTVERLKASIQGRLKALANAHLLLAQSRWNGADLRSLILAELSPYLDEQRTRIKLSGPDLILEPRQAQAVAMVVHELTTNAVKYGALSVPTGSVRLEWATPRSDQLLMCWTEAGGPEPKPPKRNGFGTQAIEQVVRNALGGTADFEWCPTGLVCNLSLEKPAGHSTARTT